MLSKMADEKANYLVLVLLLSAILVSKNCDIKISIRARRASVFVPLVLMLILMSQGVFTCFMSGVCAYACVLVKTTLNVKVFLKTAYQAKEMVFTIYNAA